MTSSARKSNHDQTHEERIETMKLTSQALKDLITQALQDTLRDAETEYPSELIAEPQHPLEDPPEPILENQALMNKLTRILNKLEADERRKLFAVYGYYTQAHLLKHLNNVKKASEGDL